MKTRGMVLLVATLCWGQASAAPDVRMVLAPSAFDFVVDEVTERITGRYELGDFGGEQLFECPRFLGGEPTAELRDVGFDASLTAFSITPTEGKLTATFYTTVDGSAQLRARDLLCVTGNADCEIRFEATEVPVRVEIVPSLKGGEIELASSDVIVDLAAHNFDIDLGGCGVGGEVADLIYGFIEGRVLDLLRGELEKVAKEEMVTALEDLLGDFGEIGGDAGLFRIEATPSGLPIDENGIGVDLDVDVAATQSASCTVGEAPELAEAEEPPKLGFEGEHLGLAISAAMLQNALVEAWLGGMLCLADAQSDQLSGAFAVKAPNPPRVELVPGDEARLRILIPGMELTLEQGPGISATMDVTVELGLGVDLSSAVLLTDPEVTLQNLNVSSADNGLIDYGQLLQRVVPALVRQPLSDAVVLPRVLHRDGGVLGEYFVSIARSEASETHLLLYAVLTKRPEHDDSPPETELVEAPDGWAGATTQLIAAGVDDKTPTALMRYRWRVDGGDWTAPEIDARHTVQLDGGQHTVEVAAVDLNDNADETPATVTFEVDAQAPTIRITKAPPDTLRETRFVVTFSVEDDRTPVEQVKVHVVYQREVEGEDNDAPTRMEDVIGGSDELELFVLGPGLHTLLLVAEDQAGNRSAPAQALFEAVEAVEVQSVVDEPVEEDTAGSGGGCCSVHGQRIDGAWSSVPALVLLALHFAFARGRRRRRRW